LSGRRVAELGIQILLGVGGHRLAKLEAVYESHGAHAMADDSHVIDIRLPYNRLEHWRGQRVAAVDRARTTWDSGRFDGPTATIRSPSMMSVCPRRTRSLSMGMTATCVIAMTP